MKKMESELAAATAVHGDVLSDAARMNAAAAFADDDQLLGDLVISIDTARRQAEERHHSLRDELRILMVHGVLHLLGYDHEADDQEYEDMVAAERKLLLRLGWKGQGLIDAASGVEA